MHLQWPQLFTHTGNVPFAVASGFCLGALGVPAHTLLAHCLRSQPAEQLLITLALWPMGVRPLRGGRAAAKTLACRAPL